MKTLTLAALLTLLLAGCLAQAPQQATPAPDTIPGPSVVASAAAPTPIITAVPTSTPFAGSCSDTDGGKDAAVAGTVTTAMVDGGEKKSADACLGDRALEYYCEGAEAKTEQMDCDNGCLDGACKPRSPAQDFNFTGSPKNAFVTPCKSPDVILNVRSAPPKADIRFYANYTGRLTGSFNPERVQATNAGFAETKVLTGAECATRGSVLAEFIAQVCYNGNCFNKSVSMNFSAGKCVDSDGCDRNRSIAGPD